MRLYCKIKRKTGVGPATSTLARWRSTTELFPQKKTKICEGRDLNPHAEALDPKSSVSANSTTLARLSNSLATFRNYIKLLNFCQYKEIIFLGQTHYKMISCNIWLPVVIHRSKTRNNALDVFWGIETIIVNLAFS